VAEQLAEAVTMYLRRRHAGGGIVASDEIYAMVEAALCDTGWENAALALQEHRVLRTMHRRRLEVVPCRGEQCAECFTAAGGCPAGTDANPWDKSRIVRSLEREGVVAHPQARAVAANVEEKILAMQSRRVTAGVVASLVANELLAMRQAEGVLAEVGRRGRKRTIVSAGARERASVSSGLLPDAGCERKCATAACMPETSAAAL
jgi:hypothetical protein